jgi:hypothetical protein
VEDQIKQIRELRLAKELGFEVKGYASDAYVVMSDGVHLKEFGVASEYAIKLWDALLAAEAKLEAEKSGIYIASKTRHAAKWRALRDSGVPIISTWIDEAGVGETKCFENLWERCIGEPRRAAALIVYAEDGDELKGALVEVGAALASETPVYVVGKVEPLKTARNHRLVTEVESLETALKLVAPPEGQ